MSDAITPALTRDEWAASLKHPELPQAFVASGNQIYHAATGEMFTADERRHALAALALHGQSYSPATREIAALLRDFATNWFPNALSAHTADTGPARRMALEYAARIEALLPPQPLDTTPVTP